MIISNNFSSLHNEGVVVFRQNPIRRLVQLDFENREWIWDEDENEEDWDSDEWKKNSLKGNFFLSLPYSFYRIDYVKIDPVEKPKKFRPVMKPGFYPRSLLFVLGDKNLKNAYIPPFSNIDAYMKVCISLGGPFGSVEELTNSVVSNFWQTTFNLDIVCAISNYGRKSLLSDHRKWQKKTKAEPLWVPNGRFLRPWLSFDPDFFFGKSGNQLSDDDWDDWDE